MRLTPESMIKDDAHHNPATVCVGGEMLNKSKLPPKKRHQRDSDVIGIDD